MQRHIHYEVRPTIIAILIEQKQGSPARACLEHDTSGGYSLVASGYDARTAQLGAPNRGDMRLVAYRIPPDEQWVALKASKATMELVALASVEHHDLVIRRIEGAAPRSMVIAKGTSLNRPEVASAKTIFIEGSLKDVLRTFEKVTAPDGFLLVTPEMSDAILQMQTSSNKPYLDIRDMSTAFGSIPRGK